MNPADLHSFIDTVRAEAVDPADALPQAVGSHMLGAIGAVTSLDDASSSAVVVPSGFGLHCATEGTLHATRNGSTWVLSGVGVPLATGSGGGTVIVAPDSSSADVSFVVVSVPTKFDGEGPARPQFPVSIDVATDAEALCERIVGEHATSLVVSLRLLLASVLLGIADSAVDVSLAELDALAPTSSDRWAHQALKHAVVDITTRRDTGSVHAHRALEAPAGSMTSQVLAALSAIEARAAVRSALPQWRSIAVRRTGAVDVAHWEAARRSVETVDDVLGDDLALRDVVYRNAVPKSA